MNFCATNRYIHLSVISNGVFSILYQKLHEHRTELHRGIQIKSCDVLTTSLLMS